MATAKKKAPAKKAAPKPETVKVHTFADLNKLPIGSSLPAPCHGSHPGVSPTWGE